MYSKAEIEQQLTTTGPGKTRYNNILLYTPHTQESHINDIKICDLICLWNTKNNVRGKSYADINSTYDQTKKKKKTQY